PLTRNEMLQMLVQFLVAGNETTTSLLTSVMFKLLTEPEVMAAVRADLELVPKVVEEVLRLESPVQGIFRTANEDVEIGGVKVGKGPSVHRAGGSRTGGERGVRAPARRLRDRARERARPAFGEGEPFCLGAPIAGLDARVGIAAWLRGTNEITVDIDPED